MGVRAETLQSVLGKSEVRLIEPTFPLEVTPISDYKTTAIFTPPVHHARPAEPFNLTVQSTRGGIELAPFQILDNYGERAEHVVGGIVIGINHQERLVLVCNEYPLNDVLGLNGFLGVVPHAYLIKVNPEDTDILVKPILEHHKGQPYVLQNRANQRIGLLLDGTGLVITGQEDKILVERVYKWPSRQSTSRGR